MPDHAQDQADRQLDDLWRCGRCGACLAGCPIYSETATETNSPRGRLALIRALAEGRLEAGKNYARQIYNCTDCMACTEACPAGVKVNELVLKARARLPAKPSRLQSLLLDRVVASPARLRLLGHTLRLYQNSGLRRLVRSSDIIIPDRLSRLEGILPRLPAKNFEFGSGAVIPAENQRKYRVGYFVGCAQNLIFTSVARATVGILTRNGSEVVIPGGWKCCGMPHIGYGEEAEARSLARENIDAFQAAGVEAIITDCATCGAMLKKYGSLLQDDPEYAAPALAFSEKVRDLSQFLADDISLHRDFTAVRARVTYHDPCHLARGQGIKSQPRHIMSCFLGGDFVEMKDSDRCCGGAGTYGMTHYETSMKILERKIASIEATGADTVVTSCPGCQTQLSLGIQRAGLEIRVVHLAELIYRAYQDPGLQGNHIGLKHGLD